MHKNHKLSQAERQTERDTTDRQARGGRKKLKTDRETNSVNTFHTFVKEEKKSGQNKSNYVYYA